MSPDLRATATAAGHVIENPLSGERITIRPGCDGGVLE